LPGHLLFDRRNKSVPLLRLVGRVWEDPEHLLQVLH
jgi:hypothetical protein